MFGNLSPFGRPLPDNCRLTYSRFIGGREYARNVADVDRFVASEARQSMASQIAHVRMKKTEGDHSVEFRCDVYVFSPDEFWQIVEEAARELSRGTLTMTVTP